MPPDRGANLNTDPARSCTTPVLYSQDSNWLPIHYAAWGGHEKAVRELVVRGADVNGRDADRKTPLHYAVLGGHAQTVEALCDHGALVNAADKDGQTPLHKAAVQGQLTLAQELLARGANPDAKLQVHSFSPFIPSSPVVLPRVKLTSVTSPAGWEHAGPLGSMERAHTAPGLSATKWSGCECGNDRG